MDALEQALHNALVLKCQLGDRQAMQQLFLRHNRALNYYLRRLLDRDDVDDVQQEIWLTMIRKISRLKNPQAFVVWLYQIARNKALTRISDRRWTVELDENHSATLAEPESEITFSAADAAEVHEALNRISPAHREVLVLRFIEGLSYDQIAEVVECSVGTVRSRLHYARATIAKQLEKRS
jgi:RNA polymerase sigma-70 factor (ECF subfamily)